MVKSVNIIHERDSIRIEFWNTGRLVDTIHTVRLTVVELKKINDFMDALKDMLS